VIKQQFYQFFMASDVCQLLYFLEEVSKDAAKDSFAEKLFTNVVKNLELTVTNIHIRYEDRVTNPGCPFSVGVSLHELSCRVSTPFDLLHLIVAFVSYAMHSEVKF